MLVGNSRIRFGLENSIRRQDFYSLGTSAQYLDETGEKALEFVKNALLANMVTARLMQTESDKVELLLHRKPVSHISPANEDEFEVTVRENIPNGRVYWQSFRVNDLDTSEKQAQFIRFFHTNIMHASRRVREYLDGRYREFVQ